MREHYDFGKMKGSVILRQGAETAITIGWTRQPWLFQDLAQNLVCLPESHQPVLRDCA